LRQARSHHETTGPYAESFFVRIRNHLYAVDRYRSCILPAGHGLRAPVGIGDGAGGDSGVRRRLKACRQVGFRRGRIDISQNETVGFGPVAKGVRLRLCLRSCGLAAGAMHEPGRKADAEAGAGQQTDMTGVLRHGWSCGHGTATADRLSANVVAEG
jgi:hypothetical protein